MNPSFLVNQAMTTTGFSDLNEDLTSEILARLPVKSLLRFKCVRKSWYALIKNPSFIAKHFNYASSKNNEDDNTRIALRRWDHSGDPRPVLTLLSNKTVEICHDLVMPFFDEDGDMYYDKRLCGPCNGIICVFNYHPDGIFPFNGRTHGARIALWNPATREFKELLDSDLSFRDDVEVFFAEIGFGFDSKSNDYKVVRMRHLRSKESEKEVILDSPIMVEVYNLSTESWRRIDDNVPKNLQPVGGFSTYLNGFYYWWAADDNGEFVLSFDFANEEFEKIPPPEVEDFESYISVVTLNESIAVGILDRGDFGNYEDIVVWMLNRDGERKTWTKQLILPFQSSAVLGFLRNGEALIRNAGSSFVRYDPSSQESKDVIIYDSVWGYHQFRIAIYVESLVPLKGAYELDHSKTIELDDRFLWIESPSEEQNLESSGDNNLCLSEV